MGGDPRPDGGGDDVPRILVRCGDESRLVSHVEHGIEEDGVPWAVESGATGDGVSVAFEAARASSLKIGVSVLGDRVVVHHKQLPDDDPLFDVREVSTATARKLGSNAARLAKGTPLKPLD
ncbi:glycerol dehydratase reactivase beta/small subunit family protein [Halomarina litorea]|uniref:glycerol dehydratase reactivase beta/small subunit family protein n=1 Tax=Halomarina litorea TaxID=2961595 RepID=UPI0020C3320E|nr:glycerol dehydratase reactivase beta/small subunit family protein [Halomarina sp. BCD28]